MPRSSSSNFILSKGSLGKNQRRCHSFSNAPQSGAFAHSRPSACSPVLFPSDLHSSPGCRSDLSEGSETSSCWASAQNSEGRTSRGGAQVWAWSQSPRWIPVCIQVAISWSAYISQCHYSPRTSSHTLIAPAALCPRFISSIVNLFSRLFLLTL